MNRTTVYRVAIVCLMTLGAAGCGRQCLQEKQEGYKYTRIAEVGQNNFIWPDGKRAAVSLTFDDARPSEVDNGLEILDRYGVKGTFYVIPATVEQRLDGWKRAVANGHEIGNHTMTHPCSGNYLWVRTVLEDCTLETIEQDMEEANIAIQRLLGVRPTTFGYPCGQAFVGRSPEIKSYVPVVARKFAIGRNSGDQCLNDPAFCDLAQVYCMGMDYIDVEQAIALLERAAENGQWLILAGHEVNHSGDQTIRIATLKAICKYASDPANGLWIDRVDVIGRYIAQQRQAP
jgi:peptidoglycan/xylan/chitin deacetylase (PgdA/CDA1 family)